MTGCLPFISQSHPCLILKFDKLKAFYGFTVFTPYTSRNGSSQPKRKLNEEPLAVLT